MTKNELVKKIAHEGKVSLTEAQAFYNLFEKVLFEALTTNVQVVLSPQLGTFKLRTKGATTAPEMKGERDKKTGKMKMIFTGRRIKVPACTQIRFQISKSLKEEVKKIKLQTR